MPKRLAKKADHNCSGRHVVLPSQEPLLPYELDPMFDSAVIRNRIGEVIARLWRSPFANAKSRPRSCRQRSDHWSLGHFKKLQKLAVSNFV
jgi:hypothetical protein